MAGPRHALILRSKGQKMGKGWGGRQGLHVDMTAHFFNLAIVLHTHTPV